MFFLKPNNNTFKREIYSRDHSINFDHSDSIGNITGFSRKLFFPGQIHLSDLPVNVVKD